MSYDPTSVPSRSFLGAVLSVSTPVLECALYTSETELSANPQDPTRLAERNAILTELRIRRTVSRRRLSLRLTSQGVYVSY